jgi:hypothetical protein
MNQKFLSFLRYPMNHLLQMFLMSLKFLKSLKYLNFPRYQTNHQLPRCLMSLKYQMNLMYRLNH